MKRMLLFSPIFIIIFLGFFFWKGLAINPQKIPSALIEEPAPNFSLPSLLQTNLLANKTFKNEVVLLHFWATWCQICYNEHPELIKFSKTKIVPIYGILYKDTPENATKWIKKLGNPYQAIGLDFNGDVGISFGVYGTPETYLIDKNGDIRYKVTGALTDNIWHDQIVPLVEKLQQEAKK